MKISCSVILYIIFCFIEGIVRKDQWLRMKRKGNKQIKNVRFIEGIYVILSPIFPWHWSLQIDMTDRHCIHDVILRSVDVNFVGCGKAVYIAYCVCGFSYTAWVAVLSSVACPPLQCFSHIIWQTTRFSRKSYLTYNGFEFSLQIISETFHVLTGTVRHTICNVSRSACTVPPVVVVVVVVVVVRF